MAAPRIDYTAPRVTLTSVRIDECPICGQAWAQPTGKRGRPRVYCGDACRDVAKAFTLLESRLAAVQAQATDEAWRRNVRGKLFGMANSRGTNQHTKRAAAKARRKAKRAGR